MSKRSRVFLIGLILLALYVAIAFAVFAFRHPELTDTERILRWEDALTWK